MDIRRLDLKLESNNKTLEVGKGKPYRLLHIEGIESPEYEHFISGNTLYDGSTIDYSKIKDRPIMAEIEYTSNNTTSERQKIVSFFNLHHKGQLTINYNGIKRLAIYAVRSFQFKNKSLYEPLSFLVNLYCENPFLIDEYKTEQEISTWIGGLQFPFSLPFSLKQRGETRQNIYNAGDVEAPIEIIFKGPALNPRVENITTGEFIKINRELTSDDTLYITTHFGNKRVEVERNNTRENAFNYIDLDSTFFSLVVGDNLIEYTTESELISQGVGIRYHNRHLGI